ncbi:hypothetical protein BGZ60DRAFT_157979 [Tricladium varicosporioides]|nr:hypothetical protein BGZ60DRAFT_157979 [Hymenoscyphus varicosporioides]
MATRRSHTKSRNGCKECKRRKVKCDEQHPSCFNCTSHRVTCSFSIVNKSSETNSPTSHSHHGGASGTLQAAVSPTTPSGLSFMDFSILSDSSQPLPSPGDSRSLWIRDLELMHHYCTSTCTTMAIREDMRHVWRTVMPREGYLHPFVMHGILAISALHKAYLLPDKRHEYLIICAYHHNIGQETFRNLLIDVKDENWRPIFCFALMLVAYVRCLHATKPESFTMTTPISTTLELFFVIRGIKAVLDPFMGKLRGTDLTPVADGIWLAGHDPLSRPNPSLQFSPLPNDTFHAIAELGSFLKDSATLDSQGDYEESLSGLRLCAINISYAGINVEAGAVLMWPYTIPHSFMTGIRERKPHALLVLSYYAPLLAVLDSRHWFLSGYGKDLLADIVGHLADQEQFQRLLEWPKAHT